MSTVALIEPHPTLLPVDATRPALVPALILVEFDADGLPFAWLWTDYWPVDATGFRGLRGEAYFYCRRDRKWLYLPQDFLVVDGGETFSYWLEAGIMLHLPARAQRLTSLPMDAVPRLKLLHAQAVDADGCVHWCEACSDYFAWSEHCDHIEATRCVCGALLHDDVEACFCGDAAYV